MLDTIPRLFFLTFKIKEKMVYKLNVIDKKFLTRNECRCLEFRGIDISNEIKCNKF